MEYKNGDNVATMQIPYCFFPLDHTLIPVWMTKKWNRMVAEHLLQNINSDLLVIYSLTLTSPDDMQELSIHPASS